MQLEHTDKFGILAAKLSEPFAIRCTLLQDDHDNAVAVPGSFHEMSFCPNGHETLLLHGTFFGGLPCNLFQARCYFGNRPAVLTGGLRKGGTAGHTRNITGQGILACYPSFEDYFFAFIKSLRNHTLMMI